MFREFLNRFKTRNEDDMPVAKISWSNTRPHQIYVAQLPSFCWVSVANKMGTRKQLSDFVTCRESFIHYLRGQIQEDNVRVPRNRVAFLMAKSVRYDSGKDVIEKFSKKFDKEIRLGVKLVNIIEAHYGWTRTKMYNVAKTKANGVAFLITGPSRWMRAPQLLSFYTLMLRMGRFSEFENVNTIKGFNQVARKVISSKTQGEDAKSERIFLNTCLPYWQILLDNMDYLYKGKDLERTYNRAHLNNSSGFSEGIHTLCQGRTQDLELRAAWKDLIENQRR